MIDLTEPLRVHIVGVGGAGMSAIATVLAAMGHHVSGSDLKDSAGLRRLEAAGVRVVHLIRSPRASILPQPGPEVNPSSSPVGRQDELGPSASISSPKRSGVVIGSSTGSVTPPST